MNLLSMIAFLVVVGFSCLRLARGPTASLPNYKFWSEGLAQKQAKKATTTIFLSNDENEGDTAIIITSSWVQTHPTLYFIDTVIDSLKNLQGLSSRAPIYIAVDGLRTTKDMSHIEQSKRLEQLDKYVEMLHLKYDNQTNIHIVVSMAHKHISGNVQKLLRLIESHHPNIKYLYYLQHDFSFKVAINHTALILTMEEHEDDVNIIRFLFRKSLARIQKSRCKDMRDIQTNGLHLLSTNAYSDNNHLANFEYYKSLIDDLGGKPRPPEDPIQNTAGKMNCTDLGLWVYQNPDKGKYFETLDHLDGRLSTEKKFDNN